MPQFLENLKRNSIARYCSIDHSPVWSLTRNIAKTLIIHITCVDPLQLGIMGRNMTKSVASDWCEAVTWSQYTFRLAEIRKFSNCNFRLARKGSNVTR
jgi:hypothetical protein